jgi:uncharacterized membrane protein YbhN (UPF0104 family)
MTTSRRRCLLLTLLRLSITVAAFAYLLSLVQLGELAAAASRVPRLALLGVAALVLTNLLLGALRWRVLLSAYGAPNRTSVLSLFRLYLIAMFYNTYLPGGVGGDVVRGVASRGAFDSAGTTRGLAVVFVERALGLCAVFALVAIGFFLRPLPEVKNALTLSLLGIAATAASVLGLALGPRIAPLLPARLRPIPAALPRLTSLPPFAFALLVAVAIQLVGALCGHILVAQLDAHASLPASLVVVPLAMSASYLPITVGGIGTREAAFVALYRLAGVADAHSLAASLLLFLTQAAVAAVGGIMTLLAPLTAARASHVPQGEGAKGLGGQGLKGKGE